MNFNEFNLFETNEYEFKEHDFGFKPSFPLFNFEALKDVQFEEFPLNLLTSQKVSEIIEDIVHKKVKTETNSQVVKKRGRKAVAKNGKQWDDPFITIQEIIENDLAGTPMESEIKMREEKLRKMREKKALKKAEREKGTTVEIPAVDEPITETKNTLGINFGPFVDENQMSLAPKIIFKDGKIVVENSDVVLRDGRNKNLTIQENNKPYKITSMSFRTRNNTAKWTEEETRKFYKAIEIFGADFSMIAKLFPTRNRDQVKNKFRKEEKVNSRIMDEAFKKNTVLGKRSLMDRIKTFDKDIFSETNNRVLAIEGPTRLERTLSNTTTDSMDEKIMEEIQQIFVKEIIPQKNLVSLGQLETRMEAPFETYTNKREDLLELKNIHKVGMEIQDIRPLGENMEQEKAKNNEENLPKKQNLLLQKILI